MIQNTFEKFKLPIGEKLYEFVSVPNEKVAERAYNSHKLRDFFKPLSHQTIQSNINTIEKKIGKFEIKAIDGLDATILYTEKTNYVVFEA